MKPPETLEQLVARINAGAFLPPDEPTARMKGRRNMAKPIKLKKGQEFQFKAVKGGGEAKYPWDQWFDGQLWLIERSTVDAEGNVTEKRDFDAEVNAMPGKLKAAARRAYKVVQISRLDADGNKLKDSLIIKARDMTEDERQAEDLLRAEEKAELVAKRQAKKVGGSAAPTTATNGTLQDNGNQQDADANAPAHTA